jgi:hypothetical protein
VANITVTEEQLQKIVADAVRQAQAPQRAGGIPSMQMTTWKNPTEHTVKFSLMFEAGRMIQVVIPPGETFELYSHFDDAIQEVRDGVVVSGLAPHLVAQHRGPVPMNEILANANKLGDQERELRLHGIKPTPENIDAMSHIAGELHAIRAGVSAGHAASADADVTAELAVAKAEAAAMRAELDALKALVHGSAPDAEPTGSAKPARPPKPPKGATPAVPPAADDDIPTA